MPRHKCTCCVSALSALPLQRVRNYTPTAAYYYYYCRYYMPTAVYYYHYYCRYCTPLPELSRSLPGRMQLPHPHGSMRLPAQLVAQSTSPGPAQHARNWWPFPGKGNLLLVDRSYSAFPSCAQCRRCTCAQTKRTHEYQLQNEPPHFAPRAQKRQAIGSGLITHSQMSQLKL